MTTIAKNALEMTALKDEVIHDGKGGFYAKGDKFVAADSETAEALKERGFAK